MLSDTDVLMLLMFIFSCTALCLAMGIPALFRVLERRRRLAAVPNLEVYVDGKRRQDLDASEEPSVAVCRVCCETGRPAHAKVNLPRVDITTVDE